MVRDMKMLIDALDGVPIHRQGRKDRWKGYFTGQIAIQNVAIAGELIRFDLSFSVHSNDRDDYIRSSDRTKGTTNKVRIMQGGKQIDARVVAIHRCGAELGRCDSLGPEEVRLTFETSRQLSSALADRPLQVLFFQTDQSKEILAAAPET